MEASSLNRHIDITRICKDLEYLSSFDKVTGTKGGEKAASYDALQQAPSNVWVQVLTGYGVRWRAISPTLCSKGQEKRQHVPTLLSLHENRFHPAKKQNAGRAARNTGKAGGVTAYIKFVVSPLPHVKASDDTSSAKPLPPAQFQAVFAQNQSPRSWRSGNATGNRPGSERDAAFVIPIKRRAADDSSLPCL